MNKKVAELSYKGEWRDLLTILRDQPDLINSRSEFKGYTPLHQAAWHGANLSVIGELLALGADPSLRTHNKNQSARDIAAEKNPKREDLQFLLIARNRTISQLMRKIAAETPDLFTSYDGNQVLFDQMIDCFGADLCCQTGGDFYERLSAAFAAITGKTLPSIRSISCGPNQSFKMESDSAFWTDRFAVLLRSVASRANCIPIEKHWAVISDIFDPTPEYWGLRGDLFLWMEMRQTLCRIPIPDQSEKISRTISSAFFTLTGEELNSSVETSVPRFSRGGMSSGLVSGEFWMKTFIPLIQKRATWMKESWGT